MMTVEMTVRHKNRICHLPNIQFPYQRFEMTDYTGLLFFFRKTGE